METTIVIAMIVMAILRTIAKKAVRGVALMAAKEALTAATAGGKMVASIERFFLLVMMSRLVLQKKTRGAKLERLPKPRRL
jgi:hypothetical protein